MIRPEFSQRITGQSGISREQLSAKLEQRPDALTTISTEPKEAVEIGFEKALHSIASGASDLFRTRQENPKAFDAAMDCLFQTSSQAGAEVEPQGVHKYADGISSIGLVGNGFNGTLWIDTTPGEPGIQCLLLNTADFPRERPGVLTQETGVEAALLQPLQAAKGEAALTGLKDERLEQCAAWLLGQTDLPLSSALDVLPQGWEEMGLYDSGKVGQGKNFILGNPWDSHQILAVDAAQGIVVLRSHHSYHRQGDFEGSFDQETLTRYPDGTVRRERTEGHD